MIVPPAKKLIQIGELIKLAAETARDHATASADGELSALLDCVERLTANAEELAQIGRDMQRRSPEAAE